MILGDGPLEGFYRRRANGMAHVTFAGRVVAKRPQYYANAAVYACPTTRASFGMTLLEAMSCATPIVCSDIVGFTDLATDGVEACMVPRRNVRALADTLADVLDDPALRAQMGAAGRLTASQYGWPAIADRVLEVYARALGEIRLAA
ncbi:MAG: glycosyltransferase family 4 protein [Gemmatimonadaceae bacterium]